MITVETLKIIKENPDFKSLLKYLAEEADKLNRLDDINLVSSDEISLEVIARKRAYNKIVEILKPLVDVGQVISENKNEYYIE